MLIRGNIMNYEDRYDNIYDDELTNYEGRKNKVLSVITIIIMISPIISVLISVCILLRANAVYKEVVILDKELREQIKVNNSNIIASQEKIDANSEDILKLSELMGNGLAANEYVITEDDIARISDGVIEKLTKELIKYRSLINVPNPSIENDKSSQNAKKEIQDAYEGVVDAETQMLMEVLNGIISLGSKEIIK